MPPNFILSFPAVIEENYVGCVNVIPSFPSPQKYFLKAHEAAPSKCIEKCLKHEFHFAFIQNQDCHCSNANSTMVHAHIGNETRCNARCWSNSSLICGGDSGLSAYNTGKLSPGSLCVYSFPNSLRIHQVITTEIITWWLN